MNSSTIVQEALRGCAALVDGIGSDTFDHALFAVLRRAAGVDHVVAYALRDDGVAVLTAASRDGGKLAADNATVFARDGHWRQDPAIRAALDGGGDRLARVTPDAITDPRVRELFYARAGVREKVFLSGTRGRACFGLSAFRAVDSPTFDAETLQALDALAAPVISCVAKHAAAARSGPTLSSLPEIEDRLRAFPQRLTAREVQVLARMLYGLSVVGIALDLGIGEESVATYRKRAFRRLRIATRNELLGLYLA